MFNKELYPDFIFDYQGITMKVEPTEIEFTSQIDEPMRISLEGVLKPIDNEELERYNKFKHKEEKMRIDGEIKDPYYIDNTYHSESYRYDDFPVVDPLPPIRYIPYKWDKDQIIKIINNGVTIFDNEEDEMSLIKEYKRAKLNEEEKKARDWGALTEDGTLTECGKDLLLNLLLEDKEIHDKFIKAIDQIDKESDEE